MTKQTICFVAGKSGGHIIPCLTIATRYTYKNNVPKILFFSANTPLDYHILSQNNEIDVHIPLSLSSIHAASPLKYICILINFIHSFCLSFFYLVNYRPSKIITTGGIVALPACYAAFLLRIPINIYCLDAIPGKAIKAVAPIASSIAVCFKSTTRFFKKSALSSYPVRYTTDDLLVNKTNSKKDLQLTTNKKTIAFLGGSQGSLFLNNFVKKWITHSSFSPETIQIIHQTGSVDQTNWQKVYTAHTIAAHVFNYKPNLAHVYASADLIICRAGAGTLFEIEFFKKKCIIIPLKTLTTDHQEHNARAMSKQFPNHFSWIRQEDIEKDPENLYALIDKTLKT